MDVPTPVRCLITAQLTFLLRVLGRGGAHLVRKYMVVRFLGVDHRFSDAVSFKSDVTVARERTYFRRSKVNLYTPSRTHLWVHRQGIIRGVVILRDPHIPS